MLEANEILLKGRSSAKEEKEVSRERLKNNNDSDKVNLSFV